VWVLGQQSGIDGAVRAVGLLVVTLAVAADAARRHPQPFCHRHAPVGSTWAIGVNVLKPLIRHGRGGADRPLANLGTRVM
jgi:hypothetical protein